MTGKKIQFYFGANKLIKVCFAWQSSQCIEAKTGVFDDDWTMDVLCGLLTLLSADFLRGSLVF